MTAWHIAANNITIQYSINKFEVITEMLKKINVQKCPHFLYSSTNSKRNQSKLCAIACYNFL